MCGPTACVHWAMLKCAGLRRVYWKTTEQLMVWLGMAWCVPEVFGGCCHAMQDEDTVRINKGSNC